MEENEDDKEIPEKQKGADKIETERAGNENAIIATETEPEPLHTKEHGKVKKKTIIFLAIALIILIFVFLLLSRGGSVIMPQSNTTAKEANDSESRAITPETATGKIISVEAAAGGSFLIINKGTEEIYASELTVIDNLSFVTCRWNPQSAKPGETMACEMLEGCRTGNIKVYAPGNSVVHSC
jgi:hypothetical protein